MNIQDVNSDWIKEQMQLYNLNNTDLTKELTIDKVNVSQLLSGKRGLTKTAKAMFYYYFLCKQIQKSLTNI